MVKFLVDNMDVFSWSTYNVPRIDFKFICHQLNVNPEVTHEGSHLGVCKKSMLRQ